MTAVHCQGPGSQEQEYKAIWDSDSIRRMNGLGGSSSSSSSRQWNWTEAVEKYQAKNEFEKESQNVHRMTEKHNKKLGGT